MTKDEKKEYMRLYRQRNKDKIAKQTKGYREANKARIKQKQKECRDGYKGDFTVYYLPKHNYIGVSNQLYHRLRHHKAIGRDVDSYTTIKTFKTKKEAVDLERFYHSIGYSGANPNHKLINPII